MLGILILRISIGRQLINFFESKIIKLLFNYVFFTLSKQIRIVLNLGTSFKSTMNLNGWGLIYAF